MVIFFGYENMRKLLPNKTRHKKKVHYKSAPIFL